jgi:hypothetical protein
LAFKSSGGAGLIYVNFAKVGFLLKFILNGKSKISLLIVLGAARKSMQEKILKCFPLRKILAELLFIAAIA